MKLLIVTVVEEFHNEILKLFKLIQIEYFSESNIESYKNSGFYLSASNWFSSVKDTTESNMF